MIDNAWEGVILIGCLAVGALITVVTGEAVVATTVTTTVAGAALRNSARSAAENAVDNVRDRLPEIPGLPTRKP
jgi:uncharacterized membrane protein